MVAVAQLVRAPLCGSGGRGGRARQPPQMKKDFVKQVISWRHELHRRPELAMEEEWTSGFVAEKLEELGIEVHRGIAETGVVGVLKKGKSYKSIGLRAELDGLPLLEKNEFDYRSANEGKMHACGHDGHMAMLLGAAKHMSDGVDFDGTVYFIFQPGEEGVGGAKLMIEDGLFERFDIKEVYAVHNAPNLDEGVIAVKPGPVLASRTTFEIKITGKGTHAATPELGNNPILMMGEVIVSLEERIVKVISQGKEAVLAVTKVTSGTTHNVIPEYAMMLGCFRALSTENERWIEKKMNEVLENKVKGMGGQYELTFPEIRYPMVINSQSEALTAARVAQRVVGVDRVITNSPAVMGAEDFAFMLEVRPGANISLGNGNQARSLHSPTYNFNDEIIPVGIEFWVELVREVLGD